MAREVDFNDDSYKTNDVDFYKGTKDKTDRLGILTQPILEYVHWIEDPDGSAGYYVCISEHNNKGEITKEEICCKKEGESRARFVVAVIEYGTKTDGEVKKPLQYDVKVWLFATDKFSQLRGISKEFGSLLEQDIGVMCTDAKYQKMNVLPKKQCIWTAKEEIKDEVTTVVKTLKGKLPKLLGKRLDDVDWNARYGISIHDDDDDSLPSSIADDTENIDDLL